MKLLNFRAGRRESFGAIGTRGIIDLGARLAGGATDLTSFLRADLMERARAIADGNQSDYKLDEVQLLIPAGRCARFFCIGVNYPERNEEYRDGAER